MGNLSLVLGYALLMLKVCHAQRSIPLNWNGVVDILLQEARELVLEQNLDKFPLRDVHEEFHRKWGFITVNARFRADHGWMKSLYSVERRSNATVVLAEGIYTLTCDIGLRELKIKYEHYEVKMWGNPLFSGEINGNIESNRLMVVLDFAMRDEECVTTLKEVKLVELGRFDVQVSGLGLLNDLASLIATWVTSKRQEQITQDLEYYLSKEILRAIGEFYCDQYASLLML